LQHIFEGPKGFRDIFGGSGGVDFEVSEANLWEVRLADEMVI
jgi:hypothetical protein